MTTINLQFLAMYLLRLLMLSASLLNVAHADLFPPYAYQLVSWNFNLLSPLKSQTVEGVCDLTVDKSRFCAITSNLARNQCVFAVGTEGIPCNHLNSDEVGVGQVKAACSEQGAISPAPPNAVLYIQDVYSYETNTYACSCPTGTVPDPISGYCVKAEVKSPFPLETEAGQSCQAGSYVGHPIIPASGEKVLTQVDYAGSGAHALNLLRSFRSRWSTGATRGLIVDSGLSQAWSHNFAVSVKKEGPVGSAGSTAKVLLGDGSIRGFGWDVVAGNWKAAYNNDTLTQGPSGLLYKRLDDDSAWQFDLAGKLLTVTQRNGWITTNTYENVNAPSQLTRVTNQFGQRLVFAYNTAGQLLTVNLPGGLANGYRYDASGRLVTVVYGDGAPGAVSKTYLYENAQFPLLLTGIIDETGNRLATYSYDTQGRGIQTEYAAGADRYSVTYGAGASDPVTVTDPLGTQRAYNYGTNFGKLSVTGASLPNGSGEDVVASRVQDDNGLVTQETDFRGVKAAYVWDINRRLPLSITKAFNHLDSQPISTQWHPQFRLPLLVVEVGRSTAYTYDSVGNKLSEAVTDADSGLTRTTRWTYNSQGLVASLVGPRGDGWNFVYDNAGNLTSFKNPLGQETLYTFDAAGRVLKQTAANGLVTNFAYDLRGRVLQVTRGAEVETYSYTPNGQISKLKLANGYAVTFEYDAAQRLIAVGDNRGNTLAYTLDAMGNRVREEVKDGSGALAQVLTRTVNNINRIAAISGAMGHTTQFGYDANGDLTSRTDTLNQTTYLEHDALGRLVITAFSDSLGGVRQEWDPLDQIAGTTDAKGVRTQYTRNGWGELLNEASPDIGSISYQHDLAGNVTATTDAKGQTTNYTRDALGRTSSMTLADGQTRQFTYDTVGNLSQFVDASGSTTYNRDALGRILQKTQTVADSPTTPTSYSVSYLYHPGGQVAQITYPSGLKVYYRLGGTGQISQVNVQQPGLAKPVVPFVTGLTYTALMQPKSWFWSNGDWANRSFDADGRMGANEFAAYGFDAASRITSISQNLWASLSTTDPATGLASTSSFTTPLAWSAAYDSRNRLTSFARSSSSASSAYTYDANSNRLSAINQTISDTDLDGDFDALDFSKTASQALAIDPASNRLLGFAQTQTTQRTNAQGNPVASTTSAQVNYSLDQNGNLTSDGLRLFEYDASNRLSKVLVSQNAEASKISYLHNALGQRVFKSEPQVAQTAPDAATLGTDFITWLKKNFGWLFAQAQLNATLGQSYIHDESNLGSTPNLLGEYGNGGTKSAGRIEYIWLPTEAGDSVPIGIYKAGRFYAVHADHINTPRLVTDDANKAVWQWPYSAFGDNKPTGVLKATPNPKAAITNQPVLLKATAAMEVNLRYPGQYFDEESNLAYNGWRSYQPTQGRYTQADPIGLDGGWNRFAYVGGNALSRIDPLGLADVVFDRGAGTITVTNSSGSVVGTYPAANNTTASSNGAWPNGTFPFSHYMPHPESGATGPYGSNGNFVFDVPDRSGMGIHSGRRGPKSPTLGCVRTTDDATDFLRDLHRKDPLRTITVR